MWWATDCRESPSFTTWIPSPPSERVVGFCFLFLDFELADVAASACVSASLTSARIGVPFGLKSWNATVREVHAALKGIISPHWKVTRGGTASPAPAPPAPLTSIILKSLSVMSLTDMPPLGSDWSSSRLTCISRGLPPPNLPVGSDVPLIGSKVQLLPFVIVYSVGLKSTWMVSPPSMASFALTYPSGGGTALGPHLQAGVDDLERLGGDLVGARVQVRPGPLDRERVGERPGADGLAVRAHQGDRDRDPLGLALRLVEPLEQGVLVGDAALQDEVGVLHPRRQLVHAVVDAALVVVLDLDLGGEAGALAEPAEIDAGELHPEAELGDGVGTVREGGDGA